MKKVSPYLIFGIILILGFIIIGVNADIGTLLILTSLMLFIFYPLIKFASKKEKETKEHNAKMKIIIDEKVAKGINANLICNKCGSNNVKIEVVAEHKGIGCFTIILLLLLIGIGWIMLIIIALSNKSKTRKLAVCQECGNSWYIK